MPQSVDELVQSPHPPPHFVQESIPRYLLPPVLTLYRQGAADAARTPPCHCQLELSIPFIEEDDPTVTLEARWFIDYDVTVPSSVRPWSREVLPGTFDNPATVRALSPFDLDADADGIVQSGVHVVEVVLGEQAGFDSSSTTLPNRAMLAGYTAALYRFVVNVQLQQDPAKPSCPSAPPSLRVCQ